MRLNKTQLRFLLEVLTTSGKIAGKHAPDDFMSPDAQELYVNIEGGPKFTIRWEHDPVDNPMAPNAGWFVVGIQYYMPDFRDQVRMMYLLGCAADLEPESRPEYVDIVADLFKRMRVGFEAKDLAPRPARYRKADISIPDERPEVPDPVPNCARGACKRPNAVYWNYGAYNWYCVRCAHLINQANGEICFLGKGKT
jgi:hypothetical protein